MKIGIPTEIKPMEGWVGFVPKACAELVKDADYQASVYDVDGVTHFCVTNMPGAVPRSASQALSAAMMPYLNRLVSADWRSDALLKRAVNISGGELIHPVLREQYLRN